MGCSAKTSLIHGDPTLPLTGLRRSATDGLVMDTKAYLRGLVESMLQPVRAVLWQRGGSTQYYVGGYKKLWLIGIHIL